MHVRTHKRGGVRVFEGPQYTVCACANVSDAHKHTHTHDHHPCQYLGCIHQSWYGMRNVHGMAYEMFTCVTVSMRGATICCLCAYMCTCRTAFCSLLLTPRRSAVTSFHTDASRTSMCLLVFASGTLCACWVFSLPFPVSLMSHLRPFLSFHLTSRSGCLC